MKRRAATNGISLLELLLVVVVIAGILTLSIRRYRGYVLEKQQRLILQDVRNVSYVLKDYFRRAGCYGGEHYGEFSGNLQPDLVKVLGLQKRARSRPPWVRRYEARIVPVKILPDANAKVISMPHYQLVVVATWMEDADEKSLRYWARVLKANAVNTDLYQMSWHYPIRTKTGLRLRAFRREENARLYRLQEQRSYSYAYCAE